MFHILERFPLKEKVLLLEAYMIESITKPDAPNDLARKGFYMNYIYCIPKLNRLDDYISFLKIMMHVSNTMIFSFLQYLMM